MRLTENLMSNTEIGLTVPETLLKPNRPGLRRPIGLVAIRDEILTTFRMADEYVRANEELIGYGIDEWSTDQRIVHSDKDTGEQTKFSVFANTADVESIEAVIHTESPLRSGAVRFDRYILSRHPAEQGLKYMNDSGYETRLIDMDDPEQCVFVTGIGPKRQARSANVIQIMQDRIQRLQEGTLE